MKNYRYSNRFHNLNLLIAKLTYDGKKVMPAQKLTPLLLFSLVLSLASCTPQLKNQVAENPVITSPGTPTPISQNSSPMKCQPAPATGLPVDSELKNSHILYQAGKNIDTLDQVWAYGINDNSHRQVLNHLAYPYYPTGFLADGFHFVLAGQREFWLSDLNSSSPKLLSPSSSEFQTTLEELPKYSRIWKVINQIDNAQSPDRNKTAVWNLGDAGLDIVDNQSQKKVEIIKSDNHSYIAGNWSPDSTLFAFTDSKSLRDEYSRLYVVRSDGNDLRILAQYKGMDLGRPYWSPDGQKLVFTAHSYLQSRPTVYRIFSINPQEEKIFSVDAEESLALRNGNDMTWSPDSQWILFYTQEYETDHWKYDINALAIDTGELYCITNDDLVEVNTDWR